MFCSCIGCTETEAYHATIPSRIVARMDPLKYLFEKLVLSGRLSRWLILLIEFDLKYVAKKTIKRSTALDFCAENLIKGESGGKKLPI